MTSQALVFISTAISVADCQVKLGTKRKRIFANLKCGLIVNILLYVAYVAQIKPSQTQLESSIRKSFRLTEADFLLFLFLLPIPEARGIQEILWETLTVKNVYNKKAAWSGRLEVRFSILKRTANTWNTFSCIELANVTQRACPLHSRMTFLAVHSQPRRETKQAMHGAPIRLQANKSHFSHPERFLASSFPAKLPRSIGRTRA